MRGRTWLGWVAILHGLAHASTGMAAQDTGHGLGGALPETLRVIVATASFAIASSGFVAAGLGLLGVRLLAPRWRPLLLVSAASSAVLLSIFASSILVSVVGLALDAAAAVIAVRSGLEVRDRSDVHRASVGARRALRFAGETLAIALLAYLTLAIVLRPWHRDWGSTVSERREALPGDEHAGNPARAGDRAIVVRAPADEVFAWLLQIGEDRGGFYSYASLENLFGLHIVNAERIDPAWQALAPGDFVRATPPDWMRGVFGDRIGWEVDHVDRTRHVLALRYWIFQVEEIDARSSRLHVRTHAGDAPVFAAPLMLLGFEPAHFIMERAMLRGVRDRAERHTTLLASR